MFSPQLWHIKYKIYNIFETQALAHSALSKMTTCKVCKKGGFKNDKGLKQHVRQKHPGQLNPNKNASTQTFQNVVAQAEFFDFKNTVSTLLNSIGETFFLEISSLKETIIKTEERLNAICSNFEREQTSQPPKSVFQSASPAPQNLETPFESPKRTFPQEKRIREEHRVTLTNRFDCLRDLTTEERPVSDKPLVPITENSWSPQNITKKLPSIAQKPFVNNFPEREKPLRIIPGNRNYSNVVSGRPPRCGPSTQHGTESQRNSATQRDPPSQRGPPLQHKIALLGDSNFHGIREGEMAKHVQGHVYINKMAYSDSQPSFSLFGHRPTKQPWKHHNPWGDQ